MLGCGSSKKRKLVKAEPNAKLSVRVLEAVGAFDDC